MMETEDNLIQKYLSNELNDIELEELSRRLREDEQFKAEFKASVKQEYLVDQWRLQESRENKLRQIEKSGLFKEDRVRRMYTGWVKYAAVVVLALLSGYIAMELLQERSAKPEQAIVLTLSDGSSRTIHEDSEESFKEIDGNQLIDVKNNTLTYRKGVGASPEEIAYNELSVPVGKRYHIRLSDGTMVYINSGSRLRYPVNMHHANTRDVFLIGEGYFEVAKDSLRPFIVHANNEMEVKVLGTHFDVRAYPDDQLMKTSLAEGKVEVTLKSSPNRKAVLMPGQAASWTKEGAVLEVASVNLDNEMAWIRNKLLFIDEPFAVVLKKIERSYGVRVESNIQGLDTIRFNGDFDIETETVDDVMSAFSATGYFNYTKRNNIITLKK